MSVPLCNCSTAADVEYYGSGVQLIVSIFIENEMYEMMMLWKKKKDFYFNDEKGET